MSSRKRLTVLAVLALVFVGCSSDGDTDTDTAEPSSAASASDAVTPDGAPPSEGVEPQPKPIILEGEGLGFLVGESSIRHFEFGNADLASTKTALESQIDSKAEEQDLTDCGEGKLHVLTFPGLSAYFQDGVLAGWAVRSGATLAFSTAQGIGLGSTRKELEDAYGDGLKVEETSLGTEWTAPDGISGVLESDAAKAETETLWAGMSCIAR